MTAKLRVVALSALLACGVVAPAQTTDAVLSGSVTDPSGAPIPHALVSAQNISTGAENDTRTNQSGVYVFAALPPGTYRVTGDADGFRKAVFNNVELLVAAQITLNIAMTIGSTTDTVEVQATAGTELGYLTSSVGNVVTGRKVLELPLAGRNAFDLLSTQAGITGPNGGQNFSGARVGSLNVTVNGTNVQDNLLNSLFLTAVVSSMSVDRIEEFRVVTSPADAELGRGSGQIQVITRSGTNQFHGSLFNEHRDRSLTANTFFNNSRGQPRDLLIRNFFGGRIGGPVRKNRTFFSFFYEKRIERASTSVTRTVYTPAARQGLWRFFPGVRNGNANAAAPTVDLAGNPVKPAAATGDMQTVSVFGRDPNRLGPDTSGVVSKALALMALPNDYRFGDGLNTAGYTWNRPRPYNLYQYDIRLDHNFNIDHRLSYTYSYQTSDSTNFIAAQPYPGVPGGKSPNETITMALSLTSVLRSNLLNEFRFGLLRPTQTFASPFTGTSILPTANGASYLLALGLADSPIFPNVGDDPSSRISPVYQYSDTLSWLKGKHTFKGGADVRFVSSAGYDSFVVTPRVTLGSAALPVANINTIPGIGQNLGAATLLTDLAGSISFILQNFNSPGGKNPSFVPGLSRYQHIRQPEFSGFFKDDYKVTPHLTLNLGLRYEYYFVPVEETGKGLALAGGSGSIFGLSGTSFADMFQPFSQKGSLTTVLPVGPGTANPGKRYFQGDKNNFAPAVGLSWALPWFGENKTILRLGYGIGYERNPIFLVSTVSGQEPGYSSLSTFFKTSRYDLAGLTLPVPATIAPLAPVPLTDRNTPVFTFDDHLRTPYYQNFSASLQRSLNKSTVIEARYVGNKGTHLIQDANINEVNVLENGILDAFRVTQAGGNAPLLDKIFMGILGVDGRTVHGSDLVRANNLGMQGFLANNDVGGFAKFLSNTSNFTPGQNGGLLRRAGLPENFVVPSPQFSNANLTSNFGSSTYHSLQLELLKRFSSGWTLQANYTFSKALGNYEGEDAALGHSFRTYRDRSLDKTLLSFNRTHVWRANGVYELPFGPGKTFGRGTHGVVGRLIGGWQVGSIFSRSTGAPLGFGAAQAFNTFGSTPVALGDIPKDFGSVHRTGNGVVYFTGLQQVVDPSVANITNINGIRQQSGLRAIADPSGKLLLVNPAPGQLGTLSLRSIDGPGSFRLDVNLIKRFQIRERIEFYVRADAVDVTNTPTFSNPTLDINSLNFGRITTTVDGTNRVIVVSGRLTF